MSARDVALAGALAGVLGACTSASPANDAPTDGGLEAGATTTCGKPGDRGNELGVGKYCNSTGDCSRAGKANVCATFLDPREHFCAMLCAADGGPSQCGTDAVCVCQSHICGCVPAPCANDAGLAE